ncbi:hypothetical protein BDN72DRAFT_758505 [Pluteus cervinus]|uniref:Uncharacterized protein n=1 Tax=Pluteus cervinus TaxID=181527 RepID=A0ACD3BBM5_9AGAR|nr:hypothetical protein BDN72DRAFT_758505 [Pluteus cervinus]
MFEYDAKDEPEGDEYFRQRLDAFLEKCLEDIKAFSERELRPFEQARRYVAEWHLGYLFRPHELEEGATTHSQHRADQARSILCHTSRILESLAESSGVQSFLVSVDSKSPEDEGFLGGSVTGREYWRGLRGGGAVGAKSFKVHCQKLSQPPPIPAAGTVNPSQVDGSNSKAGTSKAVKTDLYDATRKALRSVSGIRNAEMKWTNHERLDMYGVRAVGWPTDIPAQNPSTLKQHQNRRLLDLLRSGALHFERTAAIRVDMEQHPQLEPDNLTPEPVEPPADEMQDVDISWAYDMDAGADSDSDQV